MYGQLSVLLGLRRIFRGAVHMWDICHYCTVNSVCNKELGELHVPVSNLLNNTEILVRLNMYSSDPTLYLPVSGTANPVHSIE